MINTIHVTLNVGLLDILEQKTITESLLGLFRFVPLFAQSVYLCVPVLLLCRLLWRLCVWALTKVWFIVRLVHVPFRNLWITFVASFVYLYVLGQVLTDVFVWFDFCDKGLIHEEKYIPYKWKYWRWITFGSLAIEAWTAKLSSANIFNTWQSLQVRLGWPPNENFTNIYECQVWSQIAKFNDDQYYHLYGMVNSSS